jgi:hypothetical protein
LTYQIDWEPEALVDLEELSGRARVQAGAVIQNLEWMAQIGMSLGRPARWGRVRNMRYWPIPTTPQGVYYCIRDRYLVVARIEDARRRLSPWP